MTNLASFDLRTALKDSTKLIECVKLLLGHIDKSSSLPYQKPLRHITDYMMGELEKATSGASQSQTLKLAAATRNLFELSFEVEYVCASDANMDRFIADAAIDELEIMQKFLAIDKQDPNYQPDLKSQEKEQRLRAQITLVQISFVTATRRGACAGASAG